MPFDQRQYDAGGWRTALDPNFYVRLGLPTMEAIDPAAIHDTYSMRRQWWDNKFKRRSGGNLPPFVREVGPFAREALTNLLEAKTALEDPQKRATYNAELQRRLQDPYLLQLSERLELLDSAPTAAQRQKLVQVGVNLGLSHDNAEEILEGALAGRQLGPSMPFDQRHYDAGGWRTALDPNFYARLGLPAMGAIDAAAIRDAYSLRRQWWDGKLRKMSDGYPPPLVKEVGPFAREALTNLLEAKTALEDPQKRATYNAELQRHLQDLYLLQLSERLEFLDSAPTVAQRQKLVQGGVNLGLGHDNAEEILEGALAGRRIESSVASPQPLPPSPIPPTPRDRS